MAFVFPSGVEGNKGGVSPAHSAEPDGGKVLKAVKGFTGFITRQKRGYDREMECRTMIVLFRLMLVEKTKNMIKLQAQK